MSHAQEDTTQDLLLHERAQLQCELLALLKIGHSGFYHFMLPDPAAPSVDPGIGSRSLANETSNPTTMRRVANAILASAEARKMLAEWNAKVSPDEDPMRFVDRWK